MISREPFKYVLTAITRTIQFQVSYLRPNLIDLKWMRFRTEDHPRHQCQKFMH